jgi:hypothetical protein
MIQGECAFEQKIAEASRSGVLSDELSAHIASCCACEKTALVTGYLYASAEATGIEAGLPDAGFIWWRAQIAAKSREMERALRPIAWTRRISFGVCAVVLAIALAAFWPEFGGMLQSLAPAPSSVATGHGSVMFLVPALLLVALVPLVFGLYAAWAEN